MKYIKVTDEIVCLGNVKNVFCNYTGTGAKSNPYHYYIHILYFGGEKTTLKFYTEKEQKGCFEKIFEILEKSIDKQ